MADDDKVFTHRYMGDRYVAKSGDVLLPGMKLRAPHNGGWRDERGFWWDSQGKKVEPIEPGDDTDVWKPTHVLTWDGGTFSRGHSERVTLTKGGLVRDVHGWLYNPSVGTLTPIDDVVSQSFDKEIERVAASSPKPKFHVVREVHMLPHGFKLSTFARRESWDIWYLNWDLIGFGDDYLAQGNNVPCAGADSVRDEIRRLIAKYTIK